MRTLIQKTKRAFLFVSLAATFAGCKKSESDYIGSYQTFTCQSIKLADEFTRSSIFGGSGGRSAKNYFVLNSFKLTIFKDESDKKLKGEGVVGHMNVNNFTVRPNAQPDEYSFDLKNIRLDNDTLKFQITNEGLASRNKAVSGLLYGEGDTQILGLEKDLSGVNEYTTKNPFYKGETKEFIYYKLAKPESEAEKKAFYKGQVEDFKKRMESPNISKDEKEILSNSINAVNSSQVKE